MQAQVDKEQVEILLMKTLSLKLMRGVIDQVDQTVRPSAVVRCRLVAREHAPPSHGACVMHHGTGARKTDSKHATVGRHDPPTNRKSEQA